MGFLGFLSIVFAVFLFSGTGGMAGIGGGFGESTPFQPGPVSSSCKAEVEPQKVVRVDIASEKEYFSGGRPLYIQKEEKVWVLIKRNAPIPSWKVSGGQGKKREGEKLGEMEMVGVSVPYDKNNPDNPLNNNPDNKGLPVYIGLGHCNGDPKKNCLDPLVQDALFIPVKQGSDWKKIKNENTDICIPWPKPMSKECSQIEGYWWEFNVYVDTESFGEGGITNENLPCWAKLSCGEGDVMGKARKELWEEYLRTGKCPAGAGTKKEVALNTINKQTISDIRDGIKLQSAVQPASFIAKDEIKLTTGWTGKLSDVYWREQSISQNPGELGAEKIGEYPAGASEYNVYFMQDTGLLFLAAKDGSTQYYQYQEIVQTERPAGKSLQLGTFNPKRDFSYEWWTPACKPAVYLYPEKQTKIKVKVEPEGELTKTIPEYPKEGWNVIAEPNGTIVQNNSEKLSYSGFSETYPYLFYEADIKNVNFPEKGWVVAREDLPEFFSKKLRRLGLNRKEIGDFKKYWVKKLSDSQYYFIGLLDNRELDRLEKITISPAPDTFIRVRFIFEKLTAPMSVKPPTLPEKTERKGFTAVDWGGILVGGSCGEGKSF